MNRCHSGVGALPILTVALCACLLLGALGCVRAEREEARSAPRLGRDRPAPRAVSARREAPAAVPDAAGAAPKTSAARPTRPAGKPAPAALQERAGIVFPAPSEPNDNGRQSRNAKLVAERIEKALAEIQKEQTAQAEQQLMQEITGLIVEETMTKIGYEFYEYFFLRWEPPEVQVKDYNILIAEKATPMWGSLVEVKIGETAVFGRMLKPRSEEIEEAVQEAVAATQDYLKNYEKQRFQTPDLVGSGI